MDEEKKEGESCGGEKYYGNGMSDETNTPR